MAVSRLKKVVLGSMVVAGLVALLALVYIIAEPPSESAKRLELPARGVCAHRGARDTHPENTLAAFREAVRLGAHMIEFDVRLTKDGDPVVIHDPTVDDTTNGSGRVTSMTLAELRRLDAGSWKGPQFKGERVPSLDEVLEMMPQNIWLNVHVKGYATLGEKTARALVAHGRVHQAFLACNEEAARPAKEVEPSIMICNMERPEDSTELDYVHDTLRRKSQFIQLHRKIDEASFKSLKEEGVRINFCCTSDAEKLRALFRSGVEFPLVDHTSAMLDVADELGIPRLKPIYRPR